MLVFLHKEIWFTGKNFCFSRKKKKENNNRIKAFFFLIFAKSPLYVEGEQFETAEEIIGVFCSMNNKNFCFFFSFCVLCIFFKETKNGRKKPLCYFKSLSDRKVVVEIGKKIFFCL